MKLTGKLIFTNIAIKQIEIPIKKKSDIILPGKEDKTMLELTDFDDHPNQGVVVGVGSSVTTCKEGDIVLLTNGAKLSDFNDKGSIYSIVNEGSILMVRPKEEVNEGE